MNYGSATMSDYQAKQTDELLPGIIEQAWLHLKSRRCPRTELRDPMPKPCRENSESTSRRHSVLEETAYKRSRMVDYHETGIYPIKEK